MANKNLNAAKVAKKDEFYTQLSDIERELQHYWKHFRGKVVLCNCDDPYESNFFKYFALRFNQLGLKKLICTCYNGSPVTGNELAIHFDGFDDDEPKKIAYKVEITEVKDENGDGAVDLSDVQYLLKSDRNVLSILKTGDFRSQECIELLKEADIVVTNPPFSLFREYIGQLMEYKKKFLIIGSQKSIGCKEIFPLFQENKIWWGYGFKGAAAHFFSPYEDTATAGDHKKDMIRVSGVTWFTNLEIPKRSEEMDLVCRYSPDEYPRYENYNAIEVGKTTDIPFDYPGIMGVPITFLDKYCPDQFDIVGSNSSTDLCKMLGVQPLGQDWINRYRAAGGTGHNTANMVRIVYNDKSGKPKVAFQRIFIRNKHPQASC
ncbi:adenine-specific methyltransferase EcoRI family protein [Segatella copri]|uniref:adenine-specific methyltransferase EcoRI family protein n=1 Tax=Prevotellaceae TaxID=171552 RepID=UPI000E510AFD|nr:MULTISPECIES: adenine-specific methyltransferase EcoRI family protein [Prevotellaceae]RHN96173.1 modification methylase [Prevotella sp. AM23-5]